MEKINELRLITRQYHVIGVTEIWASSNISDAELHIDGFTMFRQDRKHCKGGGVVLYVKDHLSVAEHTKLNEVDFHETIWCTVHLSTVKMLVGVCYRGPNSLDSNNDQLLVLFSKAVQHVNYAKDTRLMILGDFNYPEIDYVHHCVASSDNSAAYKFFKTTHDLFLHQHVSEPTRVTDRHSPSLLDYVFTDESHIIDTIERKPPLGKRLKVTMSVSLGA